MHIYLIRHAAAVELDNDIREDSFRYLSPEGRNQSAEVAKRLKGLKVQFDLILTSPVVRAVQTAEIFSDVLNHKGTLKTAVELIGGGTFTRFEQLIKRNSHNCSIACFGHSPDVNHFAVNMIQSNNVKELKLHFQNCSVCKINYDVSRGKGEFEWFLKSDTLQVVKA
jgi:phosphohistidine phosphatase